MVGVAEALEMGTIAEFVGSAGAVECLKELGVGYAQGYHFGKAQPIEGIIRAAFARETAA
jgi:EAL domain-containing protein (putative c-di-GMP-specific phosphodiesterase class I)